VEYLRGQPEDYNLYLDYNWRLKSFLFNKREERREERREKSLLLVLKLFYQVMLCVVGISVVGDGANYFLQSLS
jgi:hypothetical protein